MERYTKHPISIETIQKIDALPISEFRIACFLGLEAGLRLNEALNLTWRDFTIQKGFVYVRTGKGGKTRLVPLTRRLARELTIFLREKKMLGGVSLDDKLITIPRRTLQYKCNRLGFGFHQLRHTFGYRFGAVFDIEELAVLMGHSSPATTSKYRHLNPEQLRKKIENMEVGNVSM